MPIIDPPARHPEERKEARRDCRRPFPKAPALPVSVAFWVHGVSSGNKVPERMPTLDWRAMGRIWMKPARFKVRDRSLATFPQRMNQGSGISEQSQHAPEDPAQSLLAVLRPCRPPGEPRAEASACGSC